MDEDCSSYDFYPPSRKIYTPSLKNYQAPVLGDFRQGPDYHVKAEDSPLINSLTNKNNQRLKSIRKKEAIIYWVAYLQKKLYQQDIQLQIELMNQVNPI